MPVVTLTTDWGIRDHYAAAFKGRLLSHIPGVQVVDISHSIATFDVLQASYILKNAFHHFPPGTIHYSGIKGKLPANAPPELLIVECEGHFFVGTDSGLFSLVLGDKPKNIYVMAGKGHFNTSTWGLMVLDCLKRLSQDEPTSGFAEERSGISQTFYPQAMVNADSIRATVIFVDEFENLVLNVNEELFELTRGQRGFHIEMKRVSPPVSKISNWYNEVDEGELLALFNRDGYLEIALNRSNASGLLGIRLYDTVTILFQ